LVNVVVSGPVLDTVNLKKTVLDTSRG
jgi:hypothetical protein